MGPVLGASPLKAVLGTSSLDMSLRISYGSHCLLLITALGPADLSRAVDRFWEALGPRSPDFLLEAVRSHSGVTVLSFGSWASWQRTGTTSTCSLVSGHALGPSTRPAGFPGVGWVESFRSKQDWFFSRSFLGTGLTPLWLGRRLEVGKV